MAGSTGAWFDAFTHTIIINEASKNNFTNGQLNKYGLSLIIHEAFHLQQGIVLASSKLGEMEAWQIQYRVLSNLGDWEETNTPAWRAIEHAETVEEFSSVIQDNWGSYWQNQFGVGLITYPDYPHTCFSVTPCTPSWP